MRCRQAWTRMCRSAKTTAGNSTLPPPRAAHRWRSIAWLESLGLLPEFADRLELKLRATHGTKPPDHAHRRMGGGARHAGDFLASAAPRGRRHGPAACFHRPARFGQNHGAVQMADGGGAARRTSRAGLAAGRRNRQHLGISLACTAKWSACRWNASGTAQAGAEDLLFVDLPGVECHSAAALKALRERVVVAAGAAHSSGAERRLRNRLCCSSSSTGLRR